jgi:hypothetical protein
MKRPQSHACYSVTKTVSKQCIEFWAVTLSSRKKRSLVIRLVFIASAGNSLRTDSL